MRKAHWMEGFRILIGEPCEENFGKTSIEFREIDQRFRLVREPNGKSLMEYLSAKINYHRPLPDLILLNERMPVVDGTKTLELVRANPVLSGVPAMVYRLFTDGRVETVLVSRGKQYVQSSCFTYTNLKSFVADVNLFLLQMLPDSDDTVLNGTDPEQI